jgi:hypothetical protein
MAEELIWWLGQQACEQLGEPHTPEDWEGEELTWERIKDQPAIFRLDQSGYPNSSVDLPSY